MAIERCPWRRLEAIIEAEGDRNDDADDDEHAMLQRSEWIIVRVLRSAAAGVRCIGWMAVSD